MTTSKRYLVRGGPVYSRNDGRRHYVAAITVARLYGVSLTECVLIDEGDSGRRLLGADTIKMITLTPRSNGNYRLDEEGKPL